MRCQDILVLIEKLADGECTPSEKATAEAHLEGCESCRAHFRFLEALPDAARKAPLPEPAEMYWEVLPGKVMARIAEEREAAVSSGRPSAWLRSIGLRWLGALAAAVIAALVGLEVWTFRDRDLSAPSVAPKEEAVEAPKPVLRSEVDELDRQPLTSTEPAVQEEKGGEVRVDDEPVEAEVPRAAAPAKDRAPSAPSAAGLAGPADRREQIEGLGRKTQVADVSQDEVAAGSSEKKEAAVGRASSLPPPSSPPAEAQALQEEPAPELRVKERFLTPGEPARKRRSAVYQTLSIRKSSGEIQAECGEWRVLLARNPDAEEALEARYQLARCSILLFKSSPSEDTRREALEDANAFLELSPDGERADEIRKELESIRPEE